MSKNKVVVRSKVAGEAVPGPKLSTNRDITRYNPSAEPSRGKGDSAVQVNCNSTLLD